LFLDVTEILTDGTTFEGIKPLLFEKLQIIQNQLNEQIDLILEQSVLNQETSVNKFLMGLKFNKKNFEKIMISLTNIKEEIQSLKQKKASKKEDKNF
jgi:hypothetical protein